MGSSYVAADYIEELTNFDLMSFSNTAWKEKTAIFPHRCIITGQWIKPGTKAMKGVRHISHHLDPTTHAPSTEVYWADSVQWTFKELQGKL